MRTAMLMIHLLGLAMGVGTSFAFMFLGIAESKMEKEERMKFALNSFALSRMGDVAGNLKTIASLGKVTLLSGIAIVVLAVLIFG